MSEMEVEADGSTDTNFGLKNQQAMELADALIELDIPTNIVRVMLCLHICGSTTSKNLQTRCGLRQPEISTAIKTLKEHSLVEIQSTGASGRGRPSHIYKLSESIHLCIEYFTSEIQRNITTMQSGLENIQRLTQGL
tara:strand:+ start:55 stop:465 length:411 start_codon:yes stop_codon:yes gene_type:complete